MTYGGLRVCIMISCLLIVVAGLPNDDEVKKLEVCEELVTMLVKIRGLGFAND